MSVQQAQYNTLRPLLTGVKLDLWIPEDEQERLQSYIKYDEIYWSESQALQLMRRGTELQPVYVPTPRVIVDTTSHYLLKGLKLEHKKAEVNDLLQKFLKREKFYSRFMVAKHTGVNQGDWVFHITADPSEPEGSRISMTPISPATYFPVTDDDDLDKIIKVNLCEMFRDGDGKDALRKLTYEYVDGGEEGQVMVQEHVFHLDLPNRDGELQLKRQVQEPRLLPPEIRKIPVYHFKNQDWGQQIYGSSEIRGFERLVASVDQTISDEELALALEGLGVYGTDSGPPEDAQGNATNWEIAPGRVVEVPPGAYFKRVEGIKSLSPMLDHANFLLDAAYEASATFRAGMMDVQVAQSGIALAIRFLPTMAKLEERDMAGVDVLQNMWFDWTFWMDAYEGTNIAEQEVDVSIGDKLPINRVEKVAELNNMFDRKIISTQTYRSEMEKLGYVFPANEDELIQEEQMASFEMAQQLAMLNGGVGGAEGDGSGDGGNPNNGNGKGGKSGLRSGNPNNPNQPTIPRKNQSNNRGRPNESGGTEANHRPSSTARRNSG